MSHKEILDAFRNHNGRMTLGLILHYPWGYEFRARATELRKEGYTIVCEKAEKPSDNVYTLAEPESSGQLRFLA